MKWPCHSQCEAFVRIFILIPKQLFFVNHLMFAFREESVRPKDTWLSSESANNDIMLLFIFG
jgi:hypothetical protein